MPVLRKLKRGRPAYRLFLGKIVKDDKHAPTLISIDIPPHSTTWHLRMYKGREAIGEAHLQNTDQLHRKQAITLLENWRNEVEHSSTQR